MIQLNAQIVYITKKVSYLSNLHHHKKHSAAWSVINENSDKKSKTSVNIAGGSKIKCLAN